MDEKTVQLKSALAEIENLKAEVSRLRRYEDELNSIQVPEKVPQFANQCSMLFRIDLSIFISFYHPVCFSNFHVLQNFFYTNL